ncbi:MAG: FecR family protein [Fibrobacter sp.]|nr:FecR family protein [Fibrobacter sp.]
MFLNFDKMKYLAVGAALCAICGCKDENPGGTKALGTQVTANQVQSDENKAAAKKAEDEKSIIKGKVRKVIGECDLLKKNADWSQLRMGQRVVENDRIRTALESEALVGVNDGSTLLISELSDVTISAEMLDSMSRRISVYVKQGNVYFDVQKQGESQMDFRTGIAVAAIRGTAGFVGNVNGNMVASLKEGRLEVKSDKETTSIEKNQTVVLDSVGKSKKLKLKSSGTKALAAAIDSLSKTSGGSIEKLTEALEKFDNIYAVRQATFAKKLESRQIRFEVLPLAETTEQDSVILVASATPGLVVSVMGEVDTVPATGLYQHTFKWEEGTYGIKRFIAGCREGDLEIPCGLWSTAYVKPAPAVQPGDTAQAAVETSAAEPAKPAAKDLSKLAVSIAGKVDERIHYYQGTYRNKMRFSLKNISEDDLGELASIEVTKGGNRVALFEGSDLSSLNYSADVEVEQNHIAEYEVVAKLKNGKTKRAKKTYTVFCGNHSRNGNALDPDMTEAQEFEEAKADLVRD